MFHKLIKNSFSIIINSIQAVRVVLVFYSFFMLGYWFLNLAGVVFSPGIVAYYAGIQNFMHIFYNRIVNVNNVNIDFSFLVLAVVLLAIVYGLGVLVKNLRENEKEYDLAHEKLRQKTEEVFNDAMEQERTLEEYKNNKIVFAIKFTAKNLSKDKFYTKDFAEGSEEKQAQIQKEFFKILQRKFQSENKIYKDYVFAMFDINDIDLKLAQFELLVNLMIKKQRLQKWEINYYASIDVYAKNEEVGERVKKILKLINLGLTNKIVCLSTFRKRYALVNDPRFKILEYGLYNIMGKEEIYLVEHVK